ncbi:MAG: hypothetical protein PHT84_03360 [Candidatus Pacebacteria bacterium]|nr:hypothetical protein [Candidatus Paceibacterota bacterium]
MSSEVFNIYKKQGQTPLSCIKELKKAHPELSSLPMTYAGRLDPLAEGVLLVLTGDECYKKDEYLSLPKEYEVEILFGLTTDTYDLMGKVLEHQVVPKELISRNNIKNIIPTFIGKIKQLYPPYSSRTVNGKPLFKWAKEGRLSEIDIPAHNVFVDSIDILGEKEYTGKDLLEETKKVIGKVEGDFRQEEILTLWENELKDKDNEKYYTITLKISCGSGFYARVLAYDLGQKIGCPSIAFRIIRTKVGGYSS